MGAENIGRTTGGTLQLLPYARRISPGLTVSAAPTATGSLTAGSTLTAVAGTYSVAVTRIGWRWKQASSTETITTGAASTFVIATVGVATTVTVSEDVVDGQGHTVTGVSQDYAVAAAATAPAITTAPTFAPTAGFVGTAVTRTNGTMTGTPTPTATWRWLMAGVSVGTSATYTPVTADIGKFFEGEQTATNGVGTAAVRKTAGVTIKPLSTTTTTVSTVAALQSAMVAAAGGARIEIVGGTYASTITLSAVTTKSPPITVAAQDRNDPPIFTQKLFELSNWNGLIVDGLHFDNNGADVRDVWQPYAIRFTDCSNIKITNCKFMDWFGSIDVTCSNTATARTYGLEISYNTFTGIRCDGMRLYQKVVNAHVHHNKMYGTDVEIPWHKDDNRHPDNIQLACTSARTGSDGLTFEDNYIETLQMPAPGATPLGMHGMLLTSERAMGKNQPLGDITTWHKNIIVRRNYLRGINSNGIAIGGCQHVLIRDNKLVRAPGQLTTDFYTPKINLLGAAGTTFNDDVDIINNAWPLVGGASGLAYGSGNATNMTKVGNLNSSTSDPVGWSGFDVANGIYGQYGEG